MDPWVGSLGREDPREKEMTTHSSVLAWTGPWTEENGGHRPWGPKSVRHDCNLTTAALLTTHWPCLLPPRGACIPRRLSGRQYLPCPTLHSSGFPQALLKQRTPALRVSSHRWRPQSFELVPRGYRPRGTCKNSCFTSGVSKYLSFFHIIRKISTHR